jgi:homoserine O-acetyltransferase
MTLKSPRLEADIPLNPFIADGEFFLECGARLRRLTLAYETWGRLDDQGKNAILVCHALTAGAHAASHHEDDAPGWWEGLIGPGRAIDPIRHFIVCVNMPGSCYGSTGPGSIDPDTGKPYGQAFPLLTTGDIVKAQRTLLDKLGVNGLALVIGGSLGAMVVWRWLVDFPEFIEAAAPIAGTFKTTPWSVAFNAVAREAIAADPSWEGGAYDGGGPQRGLALARKIAMISYRSAGLFDERFGLARREEEPLAALDPLNPFQVELYLNHQGDKLASRFDARSYIALTRTMDTHDTARGYAGEEAAFRRIRSRVLSVGIDTDVLFPPAEMEAIAQKLRRFGVRARHEEIRSPCGHDAFLIEYPQLNEMVRAFLEEGRKPCA